MDERRGGFRITERDDEMVRFAGLHVAVEARQLAEWLEMDEAHVFRRGARLAELGLLQRNRILHDRPGAYSATAAGLERARLELPVARINLAHYEHSLELVSLYIELEREFGYGRVLSERQLRSLELRALAQAERARRSHRPTHAVALRSAARGLHFPDLVVEWGAPDGGQLAVELELTPKSRGRRAQILAAYRDAAHVERVRYYATPEALRALERTIEDERVNDSAEVVELYEWTTHKSAR